MRERTVFKSNEISHIWVHGGYKGKDGCWIEKQDGRTPGYRGLYSNYSEGNQSFSGNRFYSYSTCIAKRYDLGEKGLLYLISSHNYGPTTAGQVRDLLRAIPDEFKGRKVSKLSFDTAERFPNGVGKGYEDEWISISDFLIRQAWYERDKAKRARTYRGSHIERGFSYLVEAERLLELLDLPYNDLITKTRRELQEIPAYAPDLSLCPSNPNKRRYISDWNETAKYVTNLPMLFSKAFKAGEKSLKVKLDGIEGIEGKVTAKLAIQKSPIATIKLVGGQVLTSMGVRMTITEAEEYYWRMIDLLKLDFKIEEANKVHGLAYSVRRMPKGFTIGCHNFYISTIVSDYLHIINHQQQEG